jgi:hypothetical protein
VNDAGRRCKKILKIYSNKELQINNNVSINKKNDNSSNVLKFKKIGFFLFQIILTIQEMKKIVLISYKKNI